MNAVFLYLTTVLIWGSTWYAITLQLGVVDAVVALSISVVLEGYVFTPLAAFGAALVLGGNVLVLAKAKHFAWIRRRPIAP